jgi:hypothetical protein
MVAAVVVARLAVTGVNFLRYCREVPMKRIAALVVVLASVTLTQEALADTMVTITPPTPPTAPEQPKIPAGSHVSGVTVYSGGQGGNASVNMGGIGSGASVEGVAVINGKVFIDGEAVPDTVSHFTSKRGQTYRIERDRGGGVRVTGD